MYENVQRWSFKYCKEICDGFLVYLVSQTLESMQISPPYYFLESEIPKELRFVSFAAFDAMVSDVHDFWIPPRRLVYRDRDGNRQPSVPRQAECTDVSIVIDSFRLKASGRKYYSSV